MKTTTRQRVPTVSGWRFWLVRPGQDLLLSPYDTGSAWRTAAFAATCAADSEHVPPAPGCDCGIYAERSAVDVVERARRHRRTVAMNLALAGVRPSALPPLPAYVVGRVALAAAVPFVPRVGMMRVGVDELRAASAEIIDLTVQPGTSDPHVVDRLAARYAVPVSVGQPGRVG
jgi:hypothetical protein